jgi:hypothetical protein
MRRLAPFLLAAFLLAACTGTGGQPPLAPTTSPPGPVPSASAEAVVAELLARPATAPPVAAGQACPTSPRVAHSPVVQPADEEGLGSAPIYPLTFFAGTGHLTLPDAKSETDRDLYEIKVVWASSNTYEGPAVVRVVGLSGGHGYVSLYYDRDALRDGATVFDVQRSPQDWPSGTFVSGPGCYAYKVDGAGFSELVYFEVR